MWIYIESKHKIVQKSFYTKINTKIIKRDLITVLREEVKMKIKLASI